MPEPLISPRTYLIVLLLLLALTILTVGVSFAPLSGAWHVRCGLFIGAIKATLVLLFFMHVLHSPAVTRAVIAASLTGLCILLVLTYTDYFSRGLLPGMPGH
jgi:cytochrome c oxidase subunit 4